MKFLYFLIFIFISNFSLSHECILNGTSGRDITIYNSCKADLSIRKPINNDLNQSLFRAKIIKLKEENNNLRNQLLDIKIKLNSLIKKVNSYID